MMGQITCKELINLLNLSKTIEKLESFADCDFNTNNGSCAYTSALSKR